MSKDAQWLDDFLTRMGIEFGQSLMYIQEDQADVEFVPGKGKDELDKDMLMISRLERPVTKRLY